MRSLAIATTLLFGMWTPACGQGTTGGVLFSYEPLQPYTVYESLAGDETGFLIMIWR
jgi:hypothetical protein